MSFIQRAWQGSRPLAVVGMLMLAAAVASLVGVLVDPRAITGAPAWLKPFKFAISTAVYSFTLAWIFTLLTDWPRMRRIVGWTTAIVFVLEVAIIDMQAWRGTTSHFNISTPLNTVLFAVMGSAIAIQTLISVATAVALWRQRFADRPLGWALRLGMTLTIVGAMTGSLMTRPSQAQLASARAGERMTVVGSHTVGAADGGPGVPVTGWSREHGDLRAPHFVGLHAVQAMALIALGLRSGFVSVPCWPRLEAMHRCFYCCCGRRSAGKAWWRPMRPRWGSGRRRPSSCCSGSGFRDWLLARHWQSGEAQCEVLNADGSVVR
jgi:hypothetical protein